MFNYIDFVIGGRTGFTYLYGIYAAILKDFNFLVEFGKSRQQNEDISYR